MRFTNTAIAIPEYNHWTPCVASRRPLDFLYTCKWHGKICQLQNWAAVLRDFISLWLPHCTHGTPHDLNTENLPSTPVR